VGSACAIFTALTNFWFKRKTFRYLTSLGMRVRRVISVG
jgi:hypothetical protein